MGIYLQRRKDGSTYGTLVIDRSIKGTRIKLSTGTKDLRTARRMNDVIDQILDFALDHHLRNLISKKVTLRQLYELQQTGKLNNRFHDPETLQSLEPALGNWMAAYKNWNDKTRQTNQELLATMYRRVSAAFPNPTLEDIPLLLRHYRDFCEQSESPRTYNLVRSVFFRFVRLRNGKQSELYQKLSDIEKLSDKPKKPQTAKPPAQIERLTRALPDKYRGMVWTMCTTGVGWTEYGQMTVRAELKNPRIYIEGTKMDRKDERRRREVPLIYPPSPRVGSERAFRKAITEASKKTRLTNVRIYTFRKCYANWLVEAGVPQWRVEMYMGHLAQSQTQKYQTTEVFIWLSEDATKMRDWLEQQRASKEARKDVAGITPAEHTRSLLSYVKESADDTSI